MPKAQSRKAQPAQSLSRRHPRRDSSLRRLHIASAIADYLEDVRARRSTQAADRLKKLLNDFRRSCHNRHLHDHGLADRTIFNRMSTVLTFLRSFGIEGVLSRRLDPRAKYEMFTSTREPAKETPIKKMILEELVRRLSFDTKLQELNVKLAAADVKTSEDTGETISSMIKKYLKAAGISFDQLTRKVEKWIEIDEEREVPAKKPEPPPIAAVEPLTFVRWKFKGTTVSLYPGQPYSFVFETDAAPSYWNPADQTNSRIKVLAHGVDYVGAGEMKGGRVRCHFQCPEDAVVGRKGFIQVQLDYEMGAAKTHRLPVIIVEKVAKPHSPRPPKDDTTPGAGEEKKVIQVKIREKDFSEVDIPVVKPIPVKRDEPNSPWQSLGWPLDQSRVGFSIRSVAGKSSLVLQRGVPAILGASPQNVEAKPRRRVRQALRTQARAANHLHAELRLCR